MKKCRNKKNLFAFLIIISLMVITTIPVFNQNDKGVPTESLLGELKTSAGEITIITPENITYTEPMSGYYPGTFGFENDKSGQHPNEWSIYEGGGSLEVIPEKLGHNKVIQIYRNSTPGEWVYMSFMDSNRFKSRQFTGVNLLLFFILIRLSDYTKSMKKSLLV